MAKRRVTRWPSTRCFLETLKFMIWLGQTLTFGWVITMVTVHNVAMVTKVMYIYPMQCVDPVLLIHKSTSFLKVLINIYF